MSKQPRGLGRGLGALIPTGPAVVAETPASMTVTMVAPEPVVPEQPGPKPVAGAYFLEIPVEDIAPNPRQPRDVFDEETLRELATSIGEVGLLQPVVVRATGDGGYELVMGERRWRASKLAGLSKIPAIVRSTQEDKLLLDALIENLQREQLNALEEAAAYRQLLDDFGATHEQLATRVGRSRSHVTNTLRLLNLPAGVQLKVAAGTISAGHARALLGLNDPAAQEHLAHRITAELLSVRAVEEIVAVGDAKAAPAPTPRAPRAKPAEEPALRHLADRLSDRFETRVKVDFGRRKGRIVVEFATIDDLERIIDTMAPGSLKVAEG
ncbi:ParB/RepB/Spo0J family partition protein [Streptosporangium sp. NBC_01755]|uniref:ParB/RepB/Spo0J family partition protein n=1 Tax=unclassified Streptosporangium TaxID=2632669 RepID=UPI002DD7DE43|nr:MULTISPECIES: ParB/RepB/Spo0J family partition protein [unclassified Streptosporangium]WSA25274.1 ParB/RepB/Spo0J family partition protein [Streptosporangium sp. NBC_01810]WSD03409.1 ParB/RepB/Spo0J family partition protein [Streptosporangium sp. NBC_01755]